MLSLYKNVLGALVGILAVQLLWLDKLLKGLRDTWCHLQRQAIYRLKKKTTKTFQNVKLFGQNKLKKMIKLIL